MSTAFDSTLGVDVIGGYVTAILYGIFCLQCHIFFHGFGREGQLLKSSVVLLWILNTFHLILIVHFNYWYMVTNFGNIFVLQQHHPWSTPLFFLITPTTNLLVKSWFVHRVWILSGKNLLLTACLACGVIVSWAFGLAFSIELFVLPTFASYSKENWMFYTEFTVETLTDLAISASLCLFLLRQRKQTAFKQTFSIINILLIYTVNTGLLTSILCLISIITRILQPDNFYFFATYMILSGLYSNALLGSLNARDWFRQEPALIAIPLSNLTHGSSQQSRNAVSSAALNLDACAVHEQRSTQDPIHVEVDVIKAEL
ncbi:hypothetical protein PHLGIDRAFT_128816 [Phlebiopsis gigantea 11061_1 CR5-6]|uniref:DUF6534 domain-containing protein n=1 Tax=Phlebiopsis gigantea (strain 11061_1 CR5-6) TaxID=745531 RepID=A0A0C3S5E2_PHLG1|nr:hypothetical protein PHLGIDRAFT_128816 [Phlebiopsis gigantea 11061_1 CR5-6]